MKFRLEKHLDIKENRIRAIQGIEFPLGMHV